MEDPVPSGRQRRVVIARPRRVPISPSIFADVMREFEVAADMMTHIGFILSPALGSKWSTRALKLHRAILFARETAKKDFVQDREQRGQAKPPVTEESRKAFEAMHKGTYVNKGMYRG